MRRAVASLVLSSAVGCAAPPAAPLTVEIPRVVEPAAAAPAAPIGPPDRDALLGTWLETLEGHACQDTTTVRERGDGELDVAARPCTGDNGYEMQSASYSGHALDVSFRETRSGSMFRYHLEQKGRRALEGEVEIGGEEAGSGRVYRVTWTERR